MTAELFLTRFKESIYQQDDLIDVWNNTKSFTELIMSRLENILTEDGIKTEREYFRVDLISYKTQSNKEPLLGNLQSYSWDLITAVEHENDYRLWVDEVVKLSHLSCPLRVVIGYLPKNDTNTHYDYLQKVSETLNNIDAWKYTKKCGSFLIIIGDCKLTKDKQDRCVYTPYIYEYDKEAFIKTEW